MSGLVVRSTENVSAVAGLRSLPGARPRTSISHVPSFGDTLRTFRRPLPGSGVSGDSVADSAEPPPKYMTSRAFFSSEAVSYTHLRAHETDSYLVCRLLLEKKK